MKILILQKLAMNSIGQYNPPFEPEPGELVECAIVEVLEIAQGDALALHRIGRRRPVLATS